MTAQPIAPVIPPHNRPAARAGGKTDPVRRLPLAAVPEAPALPDEVVYGFGQIDMSGRVRDRSIAAVLGWQPGDRLTLTAAADCRVSPEAADAVPAGLAIPNIEDYSVIGGPRVSAAAGVTLLRW